MAGELSYKPFGKDMNIGHPWGPSKHIRCQSTAPGLGDALIIDALIIIGSFTSPPERFLLGSWCSQSRRTKNNKILGGALCEVQFSRSVED